MAKLKVCVEGVCTRAPVSIPGQISSPPSPLPPSKEMVPAKTLLDAHPKRVRLCPFVPVSLVHKHFAYFAYSAYFLLCTLRICASAHMLR